MTHGYVHCWDMYHHLQNLGGNIQRIQHLLYQNQHPYYDDVKTLMSNIEDTGYLLERFQTYHGKYVPFSVALKLRCAEDTIKQLELSAKANAVESLCHAGYTKFSRCEHEHQKIRIQDDSKFSKLEVKSWKTKAADREKDITELNKQISEHKMIVKEKDEQLEAVKSRNMRYETEQKSLKNKIEELQDELEQKQKLLKCNSLLSKSCSPYKEEILNLQKELETEKNRISMLISQETSYKHTIDTFKNESEKRRQALYEHYERKIEECYTSHNEEISKLKKKMLELENDKTEKENQIEMFEHAKEKEIQQIKHAEEKKRIDTERHWHDEKHAFQRKFTELEKQLTDKNSQSVMTVKEENDENVVSHLLKIVDSKDFEIEEIKKQVEKLEKQAAVKRNQNFMAAEERDGEKSVSHLLKIIDSKDMEMVKIKQQVENLQERLSKEMSLKLRDQNPMIVDLNDPMNSSKLAVKFGALYDDEWTRIFEECTGDEENIIRKLRMELLRAGINPCDEAEEDMRSGNRRSGDRRTDDKKTEELARTLEEQKIEMIQKDKKYEELQSRLSKEMSAKLRSNNPNVMELSDPMNASKVAVMLMGVYDEEWTKAFDALRTDHNRAEYDTIMKLKLEVMKCYEFCRSHADMQLNNLCSAMLGSDCNKPADQMSPQEKKQRQLMIENRKTMAAVTLPYLVEEYQPQAQLKTELETYGSAERSSLQEYIVKCLETCWYMAVSDPPLYLQDQPKHGEALDPRMFQPYQTRGNFIDYVVWPAMLVDQEGGVVSKGVAEFTKEKGKTPYPNVQRS